MKLIFKGSPDTDVVRSFDSKAPNNEKVILTITGDVIEQVCEYCDGTGYTITKAYQNGGDIVDEKEEKCICQGKNEND